MSHQHVKASIARTRIELAFYVKLFMECEEYNKLSTNEDSNQTLVCEFLRKHIIKTACQQAEDFISECKRNRTPENDPQYFMARRIGRIFSHLHNTVKQVNVGDDMVHIHMYMYTPVERGVPMHNDDSLVQFTNNFVLRVMHQIAEDLGDTAKVPAFREVYQQFAEQIKRIMGGRDSFARMHLINEIRNV